MSGRMFDQTFTCAICGREPDTRYVRSARHEHIAPICRGCEEVKGYAWTGRAQYRGGITSGAFRDRRKAYQIDALADAIRAESYRART